MQSEGYVGDLAGFRERLASEVVSASFGIYRAIGSSLNELVYERLLEHSLRLRGLEIERQRSVDFEFEGMRFERGFRVDLLVEGALLVEVKSVDVMVSAHVKQTLTYLRLMSLPLGLLLNFGAPKFGDVVRRVVNNYVPPTDSPLRIHRGNEIGGRDARRRTATENCN